MSKEKYNIEISEGCTAFYTSVNDKIYGGEDGDGMTWKDVDDLVDYLCAKFKSELRESTVQLDDLIKCFQPENTEYDDYSCDQCGDTVSRTIWKL